MGAAVLSGEMRTWGQATIPWEPMSPPTTAAGCISETHGTVGGHSVTVPSPARSAVAATAPLPIPAKPKRSRGVFPAWTL